MSEPSDWSPHALVGPDIGGGVDQLIAIDDPEVVTRLVLVDSIVYDSFPEPGIARLKDPVWDRILGTADFDLKRGLTKGFTRGMVHAERITPAMIATYERPFQGVEGRLAYLRAARALRTEELSSRMDTIEKLELPTLIVWGAEDTFQPLKSGEHLAQTMPNGRFVVIQQAGHFLPEDAPDEIARLIAATGPHFTPSTIRCVGTCRVMVRDVNLAGSRQTHHPGILWRCDSPLCFRIRPS